MTAALIQPQRTGIVHHVILYEAAGAQATAAEAAERSDTAARAGRASAGPGCRST